MVYTEYIRGLPQFIPQIANARAYLEIGGINQNLFYPMVPLRDEDDGFDLTEVQALPERKIDVVLSPGMPPEVTKVFLDGDNWAYEITGGII